jgi:hypothetical protein
MPHVLTCRIVEAWGITNTDGKSQPYVRVRILDPEGKVIAKQKTTVAAHGGDKPAWNEYLEFEGIERPAECSVCLEVRDKSDTADQPADGVAKVNLGILRRRRGLQQFREVVSASWFSKAELRFELNNYATWGNNTRANNRLTLNVISASALADADGGFYGFFANENDPYVYVELLDENGKLIGKPRTTKVIQEGGANVEWNESFEFTELLFPSAYKLKLSVWDKDVFKPDDPLGKTEFALARLVRTPEVVAFEQSLEMEGANLKFSLCTGGVWGSDDEQVLLRDPTNHRRPPEPPTLGHYLKVNVLSADGLPSSRKRRYGPVCRLTLRDEWGKSLKTVTTSDPQAKCKDNGKAKAREKGKRTPITAVCPKADDAKKPDVEWDELFEFRNIHTPCLCTLAISVLAAEGGEKAVSLGETIFNLGQLAAEPGQHDFEREIAGYLWKSRVRFQLENMGTWGNGDKEDNKLYILIQEAVGLPSVVGIIVNDETDPYVLVELKGSDGAVLQSKSTTVKDNAGSDPVWYEELVFSEIQHPASCSVTITCYDKELACRDKKLGYTNINLGVLPCSADYTEFDGTTLGGTCKLNFAMHTGGIWGNNSPVDVPEVQEAHSPQECCSVM